MRGDKEERHIAVARPLLPAASAILPYLQQIDERRVYSNYGPLARRLETRLAEHFNVSAGGVATVANGTIGLTLALAAQRPPADSLCLVPSWTFVASAHAIRGAQLTPYFIDVDPETWVPDPDVVEAALESAPGPVGAVMIVAPFGAPIDIVAWEALADRHRIALVIDAAAAFDALEVSRYPAVISLHATKIVAAGEGGAVLCRDTGLAREVQRRANFGMLGSRESTVPACNGKLSEYHAAVALASLDAWPAQRPRWHAAASAYRAAIDGGNRARLRPGWGPEWLSATCVVELVDAAASEVELRMRVLGVDTRRWWAAGCHREPAFADCPRASLPHTERAAARTLGLPFHVDLGGAVIDRVVAALTEAAVG